MQKSRLAALTLTAVAALAVTGCTSTKTTSTDTGAQVIKAGTLTVCSDVPYAPFEDFDQSSATGFKGFDVDIVSEIAKRLDLKLVIKDSAFDPLQNGTALNAGQCDLAASAMTITDDRKKSIDFSEGYYTSKQSLLVPTDSAVKSIDDLAGKKVGVQKATTGKDYADENAPDATIVTFPSDAEEFQALKAGTVDALLQDLPVNLAHTSDGKYTVVQTYDTNEEYGLAIKKGNTHLVDDVNGALDKMKSDGTYDTIYNKYFKVQ